LEKALLLSPSKQYKSESNCGTLTVEELRERKKERKRRDTERESVTSTVEELRRSLTDN
jgi:hypothetical protein